MESLPLQLRTGSDLRLSLESLGREHEADGFVLGVVGNLSRAAFQCPGRSDPTVLEGNLEIITLNGTLSPRGVHLHLSISDGACQVWGGHLEPGTLVLKGADVLVGFHKRSVDPVQPLSQQEDDIIPRLKIAVMPGCPWSARALRLLRPLDIPFAIENVDSESSFNEIVKASQSSTFPQVFLDDQFVGGYESLVEIHRSGKLELLR